MNTDPRRSRRDTFAEALARYYVPYTQHLSTSSRHRNFARMLSVEGDEAPRLLVDRSELQRFSVVQVNINSSFLFVYII
jgi:hypothetical protein